MTVTYQTLRPKTLILLAGLAGAIPCAAGPIWFDETGGGKGYEGFMDLAKAYSQFMDGAEYTIDFNDLKTGVNLSNQYHKTFGVSFKHTDGGSMSKYSAVQPEGGTWAENLTGYDGTYMPNGDNVITKFDNDATSSPFTIVFDDPVSKVGAFVGMGVQGEVHSLQISLYDQKNQLIGQKTVESRLWESTTDKQNYESFFAVSTGQALIAKVEILNLCHDRYANSLILDNLSWSSTTSASVPEPLTALMLLLGLIWIKNEKRRPGSI